MDKVIPQLAASRPSKRSKIDLPAKRLTRSGGLATWSSAPMPAPPSITQLWVLLYDGSNAIDWARQAFYFV
jgi:hypothetical protein